MPLEQVLSVDLSLIIAFAALALSALSPLFSALITGSFHMREKQLEIDARKAEQEAEFYLRHRSEVIEQYIIATGRVIESNTPHNQESFGSVMGEIYLYVDSSLWVLLDRISENIHCSNTSVARDDFIALCKTLSVLKVRTPDKS